MGTKDKDKSLLEIAIKVMASHKKPQTIKQIATEAMTIKGLKTTQGQEFLPRFICDFMESGYFIYIGDGLWDLKERQTTAMLDKDISGYENNSEDDEAAANELRSDDVDDVIEKKEDDFDDPEPVNTEDEEDDIDSMLKEQEDYGEIAPEEGVETGYEEDEGEDEEN